MTGRTVLYLALLFWSEGVGRIMTRRSGFLRRRWPRLFRDDQVSLRSVVRLHEQVDGRVIVLGAREDRVFRAGRVHEPAVHEFDAGLLEQLEFATRSLRPE